MQKDIKPTIQSGQALDETSINAHSNASDNEDNANIPVTTIKKEPNSGDEIKEYAENAMNELLGCWYGYDKPDRESFRRRQYSGGGSTDSESPKYSDGSTTCGWCNRTLPSTPPVSSASGSFCSELCFAQLRRATFKRNKTCDWCHHVRHTVCHVDVQEAGRRLQFCSDRCLNQYKMNVFCRETQAHLEMHPHTTVVQQQTSSSTMDDGVLITPELWLRDCIVGEEERRGGREMETQEEEVKERVERRRIQASKIKSSSRRGGSRCSTVTSADELPLQFPPVSDSPQDLRVRPREDQLEDRIKESKISQPISEQRPVPTPHPPNVDPTTTSQRIPHFMDLQKQLAPVTILVPYPIVIPLPVPLPIPIPIGQIPESILKNVHRKDEEIESSDKKLACEDLSTGSRDRDIEDLTIRTCRKRKRTSDISKNKKTISV